MKNEEKAKELRKTALPNPLHDGYGMWLRSSDVDGILIKMAEWKDSQYPHWNKQDKNDIYDSVKGWECHKYVCIMKDGKVCEWIGIRDEDYNGNVDIHIDPVNVEEYGVDDIVYWTEL